MLHACVKEWRCGFPVSPISHTAPTGDANYLTGAGTILHEHRRAGALPGELLAQGALVRSGGPHTGTVDLARSIR